MLIAPFTDGNTRTTTYDGSDKLFPIVDENGREELGPVTEIEKNDGRPVPIIVDMLK